MGSYIVAGHYLPLGPCGCISCVLKRAASPPLCLRVAAVGISCVLRGIHLFLLKLQPLGRWSLSQKRDEGERLLVAFGPKLVSCEAAVVVRDGGRVGDPSLKLKLYARAIGAVFAQIEACGHAHGARPQPLKS